MTENLLLGGQVLCLFLVDWTLAYLCGLLLAGPWLGTRNAFTGGQTVSLVLPPLLRWSTLLAVLALSAQFLLLAMGMSGQSALGSILRSMPDVASTHAGNALLRMLSLSILLAVVNLFRFRGLAAIAQNPISIALLAAILFFHSALGHAASDGDFTRAELLQFLHLIAMTLWTGGVFISGFLILPRFVDATTTAYTSYLHRLSKTSAWSASVAIVTGALKGWIAIDARLGNLAQPGWSRILLVKLSLVCIALSLGLLHRRWIHDRERQWSAPARHKLIRTMRVEAICLALVIFLSAWLSNLDPPG
jgi:putative copper resistance protein D